MKKIALGDLGEFWYGDYKEPFEQLEGGVPGHPVGVVLKADDGKLLCAYCGKTYDNLALHTYNAHGMTARQYKEEVGLLKKSALVSEEVRRKMIRTGLRRMASGELKISPGTGRNAPRPSTRGKKHAQWKPESLNLTGRCYLQVMTIARAITKENGGRLTWKALHQVGIGKKLVRAYFGSLGELQRVSGSVVHGEVPQNADLLSALRSIADTLGRAPSYSDLRRYGLPSSSTWRARFGTLEEACRQAGLDPNHRLVGEEYDERILVAYATTGSLAKTATAVGISVPTVRKRLGTYGFPFPPGNAYSMREDRKAWAAGLLRQERSAA